MDEDDLHSTMTAWRSTTGPGPSIGAAHRERELWPVTGRDGRRWFLKRLGPWRNLPVVDEAAVLDHLAGSGVPVAPFVTTDRGTTTAGRVEESFVLMPRLEAAELSPQIVDHEEHRVGRAVALLHRALAAYPRPTNSYTEQIGPSLRGALALPDDVSRQFVGRREQIASTLEALPTQLVHGDLTPDNVLRTASGGVAGFIDLDHLPIAPRAWDVAKYLSRRVRLRWGAGSRAADRTAGWAGFVAGYESIDPFTDHERRALWDAVLAQNVLEVEYGRAVADGRLPRPMYRDHHAVLAAAEDAVRWHVATDPSRELRA